MTRERSLQLRERKLAAAAEREYAAATAERLERERVAGIAAEEEKQTERRAGNIAARGKLEVRHRVCAGKVYSYVWA